MKKLVGSQRRKVNEKMREAYEAAVTEIVELDTKDVIVTSGGNELPFIPDGNAR